MWQTYTGGPTAAPVAASAGIGAGGAMGAGQWHPTILYMVLLVALEIFAVAWLSRTLLR